MKVLGLIPARGGSKGIPGKNLRQINGKPLIGWACEAASQAHKVDYVICSSDSHQIIETASVYGVPSPFLRPDRLAQDDTLIVDVICYTLKWLRDHGDNYDYVCLIQATSPLIQVQDIDNAIDLAIAKSADTVVSGYKCGQRHPAAMYNLDENGEVRWLVSAEQRMARRQDLPAVFMRSGLVYVFRSEMLLDTGQIYGRKTYAIEVPEERAISIDTELDFIIAEALLARAANRK